MQRGRGLLEHTEGQEGGSGVLDNREDPPSPLVQRSLKGMVLLLGKGEGAEPELVSLSLDPSPVPAHAHLARQTPRRASGLLR